MLNTYSKIKTNLIDDLTKLEKIVTNGHIKTLTQSLHKKLEVDIFSLVIVGQFKRGKTTFINALLGEDILPTAIIPLTSIITILTYGDKLEITTFFENGNEKEIKLDELSSYVTEKYNPKNEKKVSRVEIKYPSPYLKNGVQIIDTPGIASVHEHNTKTTYEYLPQADVAIFLTSVDPPLTEAELHFLHDIKNIVVKTFFIQNKIDTVNISDQKESLAFTKEVIEKEAGYKDIIIYPLSAKQALEGKIDNKLEKINGSGLSNFEQSLETFLINEKGNALFKSSIEKINNFISEELFLIEIEKKSLKIPLNELENKIKIFKQFIDDSEQEKIDSKRLLNEEIKVLHNEVLINDLEKFKKEKTKWFLLKIDEFANNYKADSTTKFANHLDEFIDKQIRDIFDLWRVEEEKILKKNLKEILKRFTDRMNNILEKVINYSTELLEISSQKFYTKETLPPEIEFRFKTTEQSDVLGITINLARKALPKILAQKLIIKEAHQKAEMLVDRHCGKTRYDFSQRMEKFILNYNTSIAKPIETTQNNVLKALEKGVLSKQSTTVKIISISEQLQNETKILEEIKESLKKSFKLLTK